MYEPYIFMKQYIPNITEPVNDVLKDLPFEEQFILCELLSLCTVMFCIRKLRYQDKERFFKKLNDQLMLQYEIYKKTEGMI